MQSEAQNLAIVFSGLREKVKRRGLRGEFLPALTELGRAPPV